MGTELIQQVRVIDPGSCTDRVADVRIVDGVIAAIEAASEPTAADEVIDGTGKVLLPGLVDLYSHAGEPGHETRETLLQLLASAQAGGFTRLGLLPTTHPAIDTPAVVKDLQARYRYLQASADRGLPQLCIWGALTQAAGGERMSELAELKAAGIVGFADGAPLDNSRLQQRLLEYLRPLEMPVMFWPCDRTLSHHIARHGRYALRYGLPGDPVSAETSALAALLEQLQEIQTPIHLMNLSTARSVELVAAAKARGLPVTASTTWMHLLLNTRSLQSYDPNLRLAPPLGNPEDQLALIEAVQSGTLDSIAVNHRAYTYEEKTIGFASTPAGAIGLELALPLLWHQFASSSQSILPLVRALSFQPAQIFQQQPARLMAGSTAEMVLFDPQQRWLADRAHLQTGAQNTPWFGLEIKGQVLKTWHSFQLAA